MCIRDRAYILRLPKKAHREPRWMEMYTRWATWCLNHRVLTTLATLVFFFGSFALVPLLPTGFVPPDDLSQTQVYISLQPGSTFKETLAAAEQARRIVEKNPYVKLVYTAIGGGASGSDPFTPQGAAEAVSYTHLASCARRSRMPPGGAPISAAPSRHCGRSQR